MMGQRLSATRQEDEFDVFGKMVANKLRSFSKPTTVQAERLINDVLYEGEMESLDRNTKIVKTGDTIPYSISFQEWHISLYRSS